MLSLRKVLPVFKVADLSRSIDFYTRVLDFELCWRTANDGGGENCMLQAGAVELLLSTGSHLGGTPTFTGTLYFDTADVGALYERIKDQVPIVWPLDIMEYGQREFGVRDCDGYILAFAQPVRPPATSP